MELQRVEFPCADGQRLVGHFIKGDGGAGQPPVLLAPATGIKQTFYFKFATWLAGEGHDVLVFDYRGVGLSLTGSLASCTATLADWGQKDQVAALDYLLQRTGARQAVMLGHSAGGQMIGLMANHDRVLRLVGVAASTGWFKRMRLGYRLKAWLAMRVLVPLGVAIKGYAPTSALGLGEDLPAQVGLQWGRWCAAGSYARNALREAPELDFHAAVRSPVTVLYASDDDIANSGTVANLLSTLPEVSSSVRRVEPREVGLRSLGHINWFRQTHASVWPLLRDAVQGVPVSA